LIKSIASRLSELADQPEDAMTSIRRTTTLAVGLLLTTVLAACGSSSSGGSTAAPGAGATSSTSTNAASGPTVTIKDFAFHPASLTVKPGTKVTFVQADSIGHNATATGANAFKTPTLSKGQSYTVTLTKAGTYNYICTIHPNMRGTIVVS
jgi:plastocyanin